MRLGCWPFLGCYILLVVPHILKTRMLVSEMCSFCLLERNFFVLHPGHHPSNHPGNILVFCTSSRFVVVQTSYSLGCCPWTQNAMSKQRYFARILIDRDVGQHPRLSQATSYSLGCCRALGQAAIILTNILATS